MADIPVKYYTSSMQGAPQLTNEWGDLVTMLDACLVTGFNLKSVTTLTSAAGIATATISAGHLYEVDQVLLMAGADQAEYNGDVRVLTANATQFTFAVAGTPASPATGTLSVKVAPLNFDIAFTGTNKRVYRSKNVLSNRPYLRVDNSLDPAYTTTYAKKGKVTMAEAMTDVDTFVANTGRAPFDPVIPTKNEVGTGSGTTAVDGWYKWYYARAENNGNGQDQTAPATFNRSWVLVGDDRGFYFFASWNGGPRACYYFTDFASFRQGDAYSSILGATEFNTTASANPSSFGYSDYGSSDFGCYASRTGNATGKVCMRSHLQVGGTIRLGHVSLGTIQGTLASGLSTGVPWPNGPDYALILHPVYLQEESTGNLRGKLPGIMFVHNNKPLADLTVVGNVTGYAGRKFLMVDTAHSAVNSAQTARMAFDITGPWW
ncbi:MAG: hypothetical protein ABJA84_00055 [Polaromonas sp.]